MSVANFKNDGRISAEHRQILREFCQELGGDLAILANRLGVKVFLDHNMHVSTDGYLVHDENCGSKSGYKVVLNAAKPVPRQKFTLAHELGHFVLHRKNRPAAREGDPCTNIIDFAYYRSMDDWEYVGLAPVGEREADRFAVNLLLPIGPLKKSSEFINGEPVALADRLGFSRSMVNLRFEEAYFDH